MPIVSQGNSVVLDVGAHDGLWIKSTGNAEVIVNQVYAGTPEVINVGAETVRVGFYGEQVTVSIRAVSGNADYQDTPDKIYPLTSVQGGQRADSSPLDIAQTVNQLVDIAQADYTVKTVTPINHYSFRALTGAYGNLYGINSTSDTAVSVLNPVNGAISQFGASLPSSNITNIKIVNDSLLFVEAGFPVSTLYRSTDGGQSWQTSYVSPFANTKMLTDRSICVANINGATVLLYGSYNINGSRTPGGANDAVYLLRSDDLGVSWSEVTRWNTDGSTRNVRHIHCVKQDPVTKRIFVATGDNDPESCIYSWDGVSNWPINVSPNNTVQTAGLKSFSGSQRYRAVDILFRNGFMYWMPDTNASFIGYATESGIWKVSTDYSTLPEKVSSAGTGLTGNAGWLTVELSDGTAYFCTGVDTPTSGFIHSAIIASNTDLSEWKPVGAFRATAGSAPTPFAFYCHNDVVYHCASFGSGKSAENTIAFKKSQNRFIGDLSTVYELDTVHPVYWVDPSIGSNSNNGWNPAAPVASIRHMLTGDRSTYGGRIQIATPSYTYLESNIDPKINANARSGDPIEPCYVQGNGATKTQLIVGSAATASSGFFTPRTNADSANIGVKALTTYSEKDIRFVDLAGANSKFTVSQAVLGAHQFQSGTTIRASEGLVSAYSSILIGNAALITSAAGALPLRFVGEKVAFFGCQRVFTFASTATTNELTLNDSKFYGFRVFAIDSQAGNFSSFAMNSIEMKSSISGAACFGGSAAGWPGKVYDIGASAPIGVSSVLFGYLKPLSQEIEFDSSKYIN